MYTYIYSLLHTARIGLPSRVRATVNLLWKTLLSSRAACRKRGNCTRRDVAYFADMHFRRGSIAPCNFTRSRPSISLQSPFVDTDRDAFSQTSKLPMTIYDAFE